MALLPLIFPVNDLQFFLKSYFHAKVFESISFNQVGYVRRKNVSVGKRHNSEHNFCDHFYYFCLATFA